MSPLPLITLLIPPESRPVVSPVNSVGRARAASDANIPIATNAVVSQQVLHAILRTFDHWMKPIVHLKAGVLDWSESPTSVNNCFLQNTKQEIPGRIYSGIHGTRRDLPDSAGKGGTTTDGNIVRDLLHNAVNRSIIVNEVPEHNRDIMTCFGQYLPVILRVLSSKKKVDVEKYKNFCTELHFSSGELESTINT